MRATKEYHLNVEKIEIARKNFNQRLKLKVTLCLQTRENLSERT